MADRPKRFLTICEGGNVRSVALAFRLKEAGQDALAAGWRFTSPDTMRMLLNWCDYAVLMQPHFAEKVPGLHDHGKQVLCVDVGPDVYGNPLHMTLQLGLKGVVDAWAERGFNLNG